MNIANIKIGHRLTIAFTLATLLLAVVVAVGAGALRHVRAEIDTTIGQRYAAISGLQAARDDLNRQADALRDGLLLVPGATEASAGPAASDKLDALLATLRQAQARPLLAALRAARDKYHAASARLQSSLQAGERDAAIAQLAQSLRPAQQEYLNTLDALVVFQAEQMRSGGLAATGTARLASMAMVAMGVVGGVLSLLTAWYITRSIVGPVNHAVKVARTVASGDLSSHIEVRSRDEIGQLSQALKDMNASLQGIVSGVRGGTEQIALASSEIAQGNQDLSSRTEQQAGSLEETASSMEELTATVRQNADNARQANTLAVSASQAAGQGGAVVAQVVETMSAIDAASRKIVDIITVIDGIAFQTNILALNAAVEAARAGEQGRGFAVVANEVRNLAQRSAAAAHQIKALIGDSVQQVEAGARLVDQAGASMQEIVARVQRVTDIMGEISAASREQLAGIQQVNEAIGQMDRSTQQNAALVEQASAAAATMELEARRLQETVGVFRLAPGRAPVTQLSGHRKLTAAQTSKLSYSKLAADSGEDYAAVSQAGPARQTRTG